MNRTLRKLSQILGGIGKDYIVDTVQGGFPVIQSMIDVEAAEAADVLTSTVLAAAVTTTVDGLSGEPDAYRCVSVTGNQGTVAGTVIVRGYDWSRQVVEDHIVASGVSTVEGVVPFDEVFEVVLPARVALADAISVGTSDKLGAYRPVKDFADISWIQLERKATGVGAYSVEGAPPTVDSEYGTFKPNGGIVGDDSFKAAYLTELF